MKAAHSTPCHSRTRISFASGSVTTSARQGRHSMQAVISFRWPTSLNARRSIEPIGAWKVMSGRGGSRWHVASATSDASSRRYRRDQRSPPASTLAPVALRDIASSTALRSSCTSWWSEPMRAKCQRAWTPAAGRYSNQANDSGAAGPGAQALPDLGERRGECGVDNDAVSASPIRLTGGIDRVCGADGQELRARPTRSPERPRATTPSRFRQW
jgi:hypothetical protein